MNAISENAVGSLIGNEAHDIITFVLSRIKEEIELAKNYRKELLDLQKQLKELNELLQGSGERHFQCGTNQLLSNWLKQVRNVAYDAEDLFDYCSYEDLKYESRTRKRDKLKNITIPVDILSIAHKAKTLREKINSINQYGSKQGIKPIEVAGGNTYDSRQSQEKLAKRLQDRRQWVDNEGLVGRDQDLTRLLELVCHPTNKSTSLNVVGIVGLAGLGKTALSKRIAAAQKVMKHFNSNVFWLVVSHHYVLKDILNKLLELLCRSHSNMSNSQAMVEKLGEKLKGKRYLLILDDVWYTVRWEPLIQVLQGIGGSEGTTLLVTSRDRNVLANMDTYGAGIHKAKIHQLEGLNEADSLSLFMQRVGGDNLVTREKQKIGNRIVKKCGGIPLAIRDIGNLLRNESVEKWREIEENEEWNREEYDILPSLKLSYIYLRSMALKKCFSFCAIFGKDEVIQKENLIQMWMGQGFLQTYDRMEHVGEEYVDILLNSFFFQEAKLDQFGNVIEFKMNTLVLQLARVTSGEECFIMEENPKHSDSLTTEVRHLSTLALTEKEVVSAKYCDRLRTYYNSCSQFQREVYEVLTLYLEHSSCLRVLCLTRLDLEYLPKSIKKLKLLRYLDISHNSFETLPDVITELYHLQSLRIDHNSKRKINCYLRPEKVSNLVKLRHISGELVDIGILNGMGHLTALRTLSTINLKSNWGGKVSELASLTNLRGKLGIRGVECMKSKEEARSLNLQSLSSVKRLVLEWSEAPSLDDNQNQILEGLEPHSKLTTLDVTRYNGSSLPGWLTEMAVINGSEQFAELISLTLSHCYHATGNLNLKNLGSLRFLSVDSCYDLTISLPENGFHCCKLLESLKLSSCYNVGNLGDLSPLTRLQDLKILHCAKTTYELVGLASLPCLEEVVTDRLLPRDLFRKSAVCKSLRSLYLSTQADTRNLPNQLQHLVGLQELHIHDFKGLEILPEWLGKLTSLLLLELSSLPSLERLPSKDAMQRLSNLKKLSIRKCPSLEKQFMAKNGELFKICDIPSIIVDFEPLD